MGVKIVLWGVLITKSANYFEKPKLLYRKINETGYRYEYCTYIVI